MNTNNPDSSPKVASPFPVNVELEAGKTYFFCTCGHSASQPFCDGSHSGTGFRPQPFTPENEGEAFLCQCKRTGNAPYCDGSHSAAV